MIQFVFPLAFYLALPVFIAWLYWARRGYGKWWRLIVLALLVTAVANPYASLGVGGSDVIVIFDRSHSMNDSFQQQEAYLALIAEQRGPHDRLGIVVAAAGAEIIQGAQEKGTAILSETHIEDYASDLRSGLELAASLIAPERTARVIIHSDAAYTDRNPLASAAEFSARQIPVDVLLTHQDAVIDAAILSIELPQSLRLGESFIGAVSFWADSRQQRDYSILRNGKKIHSGSVTIPALQTTIIEFSDRPYAAGLNIYSVQLDTTNDRNPGNNTVQGVLHVEGGEHIIVMSGDGSPGNIARALQAAGMHVKNMAEGPVTLQQLSACSALILDQVPANRLGHASMQLINTWVRNLGGALILTGGRRSFGAGGYHRSAIEEILPVSMELRDEHRKLSVAMAITLDRSGSMAATVPGGQTKMDLANEGTVAAIELLGPRDAIAVHAVDSAPHVIVAMTPVDHAGPIIDKVRRIESMGGGIFVYAALKAAGAELLRAQGTATLHLILFADAADAEQPDDYKRLLADYQRAGITVSVIGLGSDKDSDAQFLIDVAKRGGGRIHFTNVPQDIPRLFAQETVLIARSSWVNESIALKQQSQLALLLGNNPVFKDTWPTVPGYNLNYLKDHAQVYAICPGDPEAPAIAAWHIGSGRSIAVAFQLDDPDNPALLAWAGYAPLITSLTRWAAAEDSNNFAQILCERSGQSLRIRLELDPAQRSKWPNTIPALQLISGNNALPDQEIELIQYDDGRFEAIYQLKREHIVIPTITLNKQAVIGAAQCLPYNPEDSPQRNDRSIDLKKVASITGGSIRSDVIDVFNNPPSPGTRDDCTLYVIMLALICCLIEIAVRRLQLSLPWQSTRVHNKSPASHTPSTPASNIPSDNTTATTNNEDADAVLNKDQGLHEALRQLRNKRR